MTEVIGRHVVPHRWDRVSDQSGAAGRWFFSSGHKPGISPFPPGVVGFGFARLAPEFWPNIIHAFDQTVVGAVCRIEEFLLPDLLPDRADAVESPVDLSTRPSLHRFPDLRQTVLPSLPSA